MFYADTQARAAQAESTFAERRARRIDEKTQGYTYDYKTDIYGEDAALSLWANRNLAAANERLRNTALWFDQPHPHRRIRAARAHSRRWGWRARCITPPTGSSRRRSG